MELLDFESQSAECGSSQTAAAHPAASKRGMRGAAA